MMTGFVCSKLQVMFPVSSVILELNTDHMSSVAPYMHLCFQALSHIRLPTPDCKLHSLMEVTMHPDHSDAFTGAVLWAQEADLLSGMQWQ